MKRPGKAVRKVLRKLKAKAKAGKVKAKVRKQEKVRSYLTEVNHHVAQLTMALRALADRLDDVRSWHLEDE
jgi:Mg2+ and Co2+ transporter CorA